ncbi:MAG: hypothetical protein E7259_00445 [Lachnospiraceae bacterium]|nr:hypothetical protein [Lachnospiraceae bacterium]
MGIFYELSTGGKGAIYDEGNNIFMLMVGQGRVNRQILISRDYSRGLSCYIDEDKVYIAYFNTQNELIWDIAGAGEKLVIFSGIGDTLEMSHIKIVKMGSEILLFYVMKNPQTDVYELRYINPSGERVSKKLTDLDVLVEYYDVYNEGDISLLKYKCIGKKDVRQFQVKNNSQGEMKIEEYTLCKNCVVEEIKEKLVLEKNKVEEKRDIIKNLKNNISEKEEVIKELKTEIAQKEEVINDREENVKKEIDGLHKMYKNKYDELVKLTQEIQEEGKKWRELYYRNVKK